MRSAFWRARLPFEPEPLTTLCQRYPLALEGLYDVRAIRLGLQGRPARDRRHCFDFPNGLRIAIARQRNEAGEQALIWSASTFPGLGLEEQLARMTPQAAIFEVVSWWRQLSGSNAPVEVLPTLLQRVTTFLVHEHANALPPRTVAAPDGGDRLR